MNVRELQRDPSAFRDALMIDTESGPRSLSELMDPWQRADFEAMDNGWRRAAGQRVESACQRAWLERGRGHSKSSDAMMMAAWALFAARKPIAGVVCAVDKDQAALDRDHVARLVANNAWLNAVIEVQQWRVINKHTGSAMEIMASDVASSYGLLIDFAVCDELTLWAKRDLFDSILSAAAKRSSCLLLCIGNAGFEESWQWDLREKVRIDPAWHFHALDGPVASWITQANLDEQRRLLPQIAFERLWLNKWAMGTGGDALKREDIDFAFRPELRPLERALSTYSYVCGVDAGISRDASAVCVLGVRRGQAGHGQIRLAATRVWRPSKGKKVDLQLVEDELIKLHARFDFQQVNYDPWELRHLASRLQASGFGTMVRGNDRRGLPMVEVPPQGSNLQRIATAVLEAFNDRRVQLYEDADLRRDLERLRVEERSYGFRLVAPRDQHGHGDLGTAFGLAVLACSELAGIEDYGEIGAAWDTTPDLEDLLTRRFLMERMRTQQQGQRRAGLLDLPPI